MRRSAASWHLLFRCVAILADLLRLLLQVLHPSGLLGVGILKLSIRILKPALRLQVCRKLCHLASLGRESMGSWNVQVVVRGWAGRDRRRHTRVGGCGGSVAC